VFVSDKTKVPSTLYTSTFSITSFDLIVKLFDVGLGKSVNASVPKVFKETLLKVVQTDVSVQELRVIATA
jgi:hypothetical protein